MKQLQRIVRSENGQRPIWLAAVNGTRLPAPAGVVAPIGEPEPPLEVEFVGLSEAEQLRALAGFPGGRRFVLKQVAD